MNTSAVENWFHNLEQIWKDKDIAKVQTLLADNFQYFEDPFNKPFTTLDEVESAWQEVREQNISELEIHPLVCHENEGTATYTLTYTDPIGTIHHSRGAYYVKLDETGKALEFRQWWISK